MLKKQLLKRKRKPVDGLNANVRRPSKLKTLLVIYQMTLMEKGKNGPLEWYVSYIFHTLAMLIKQVYVPLCSLKALKLELSSSYPKSAAEICSGSNHGK